MPKYNQIQYYVITLVKINTFFGARIFLDPDMSLSLCKKIVTFVQQVNIMLLSHLTTVSLLCLTHVLLWRTYPGQRRWLNHIHKDIYYVTWKIGSGTLLKFYILNEAKNINLQNNDVLPNTYEMVNTTCSAICLFNFEEIWSIIISLIWKSIYSSPEIWPSKRFISVANYDFPRYQCRELWFRTLSSVWNYDFMRYRVLILRTIKIEKKISWFFQVIEQPYFLQIVIHLCLANA